VEELEDDGPLDAMEVVSRNEYVLPRNDMISERGTIARSSNR